MHGKRLSLALFDYLVFLQSTLCLLYEQKEQKSPSVWIQSCWQTMVLHNLFRRLGHSCERRSTTYLDQGVSNLTPITNFVSPTYFWYREFSLSYLWSTVKTGLTTDKHELWLKMHLRNRVLPPASLVSHNDAQSLPRRPTLVRISAPWFVRGRLKNVFQAGARETLYTRWCVWFGRILILCTAKTALSTGHTKVKDCNDAGR